MVLDRRLFHYKFFSTMSILSVHNGRMNYVYLTNTYDTKIAKMMGRNGSLVTLEVVIC